MSKAFLTRFRTAREQRRGKNDARRIRAERDKARSSTSGSDRRWPFELLQNAHDPGPRNGSQAVELRFTLDDSTLAFKHNGHPFTQDDLAALLSGGSNKEYDGPDTTGRFGTGFLVTHVLSPRVRLRGVLQDGLQHERFQISLDRSGDEDAILANADAAEAGIEAAVPIRGPVDEWTAEFEYAVDAPDAARIGVEAIQSSVPFLFGTCHHLGRVAIQGTDGLEERWDPEAPSQHIFEGVTVRERRVTVTSEGPEIVYRVLRLLAPEEDDLGLVILLRACEEGWEFRPVPEGIPRIFSRFPVRTSTFLPISAVVDGRFEVQEERDRIAMSDEDRRKLAAALRLLPVAIALGLREQWEGCHRLARVAKVEGGFSETARDEELGWWNDQLAEVGNQLARLPLVETTTGFLPAICDDGTYADFVVPRYSVSSLRDDVPLREIWDLAAATTIVYPPVRKLAEDWVDLSAGWASLGTNVNRLGLVEIAQFVGKEATKLRDLPVAGNPSEWLVKLLNLVAALPAGVDRGSVVAGLLPNQCEDGPLCSPAQLKRDVGVPEELKDIGDSIGLAVRESLLDANVANRSPTLTIAGLVPSQLTESEVLRHCIERLATGLPDGKDLQDAMASFRDGAIRIVEYLWSTQGADGAALAIRCPLLTHQNTIARHSPTKRMLAPVRAWPEAARPFCEIYAPARILADIYAERSTESCDVVEALVAWGIAYPQPLIREPRAEVNETLLREITKSDVKGVTLKGHEFSQVALLGTEIIQRCGEDEDGATLLLKFVLGYLAQGDQGWRTVKAVMGQRGTSRVPLMVRDALWLAEIKSRPWVPIHGDTGNERVPPSPVSLDPLLKNCGEILRENDAAVELLIECFGFNVLSLRLEALPEEVRDMISQKLATLVQMGGSDTQFYQQVVETIERQQRRASETAHNRQFGLAVQRAIQDLLTARSLKVSVVDRGYDLDVEVPGVSDLEGGTHHLSVGPYLMEVKATTSGEVRLTPAQARVASADDAFVLCVVDLRACDSARLAQAWTASDVEPLAHVVTDLRDAVSETHSLVRAAAEQEIALRNEGLLRYGVPTRLWEQGRSIGSWVQAILPKLRKRRDTT